MDARVLLRTDAALMANIQAQQDARGPYHGRMKKRPVFRRGVLNARLKKSDLLDR